MRGKLRGNSSSGGDGQLPKYKDHEFYFTLKVHHGGVWKDDLVKEYVGGSVSYFDGCNATTLNVYEFEEMLLECVEGGETEPFDAWIKIPDEEEVIKVESSDDVQIVISLCVYSREIECYVQCKADEDDFDGSDMFDFSFTQFYEDERNDRLEKIREEFVEEGAKTGDDNNNGVQEVVKDVATEVTNVAADAANIHGDDLSFEGDSSNMDSEIEELLPKKKKKVPPPNPPFRTRRRGRHPPLRTLFANTSEAPLVIDDEGHPGTQSSQVDKGKKVSISEQLRLKKATEAFMIDDSGYITELDAAETRLHHSPMSPSRQVDKQNEGQKDSAEDLVENMNIDSDKRAGKQIVEDIDQEQDTSSESEEDGQQLQAEDSDKQVDSEEENPIPSDSLVDSAEERMAISSCDELDINYPEFNEARDMVDPQFELGMLFTSSAVFRRAVRQHAIKHQRPVRLKKNLGKRVKWICEEPCKWKVYAGRQQRSDNFQITALVKDHTCTKTWEQAQIKSTWIAEAYEDELRLNPTWPADAFRKKVINDLKCNISKTKIYRAMAKARENIMGRHEEEYNKLYDYGNAILKAMPRSTVKLMTEEDPDGRRFKRFYVCFGPLKDGFMEGCKPLVGFDGCHLKGPFGGILLTAVATDPNDGMYPLAWAQVEAENNSSWDWFIKLVKQDLNIENEGGYTFISDRQKGLVSALEANVPSAEHRFCVMHLYRNIWNMHKGLGIRKHLWNAARATTDYWFDKHMEEIKKLSTKAYDWLAAKPRSQWSRSAFREICKTDMFVNNICEVFNKAINDYRDMGIVTMFKEIHRTAMQRIQRRKTRMEKVDSIYCPNSLRKLEKSMEFSANAHPTWSGGDLYSVTMRDGGYGIIVNLTDKTCACRKWQLTGIPCFHACSCIKFQAQTPLQNNYIHPCHLKEQYMKVYNHILDPVPGEEFWERTNQETILPPEKKKAPGRPKKIRSKKNDIVEARDKPGTLLKRKGTSLQCGYCKAWGHNSLTCEAKKADKAAQEREAADNGVITGVNQEDAELAEVQPKPKERRQFICSHCQVNGHNSRTCEAKKQGLPKKDKPKPNKQPKQASTSQTNITVTCSSVLQPPVENFEADKGEETVVTHGGQIQHTHGGIFQQSTNAGAIMARNSLGVEASHFTHTGNPLTTLKNLEKARRQKLLGIKPKPKWRL